MREPYEDRLKGSAEVRTKVATTAWYYDYYEPEAFPHQQELCKAVEWTKYNLEGRQLISSTRLTGMPANPLTIRLLALREALNQLESSVSPVNEAIKKQRWKRISKGIKMSGIGGTLITQSGPGKTKGAPVEIIKISGKRKPVEFHHDIAHLGLYGFFTNFGSVMDRLAYEINLLYKLNIKKVDWPKLADIRSGKDRQLISLKDKDTQLAGLIRNYVPKFKKAFDYRNRLIHDGIIRVETDVDPSGLSIRLAEDPNDNKSPMKVDAISFCKETKTDTLKLLNESYKVMLERHKAVATRLGELPDAKEV